MVAATIASAAIVALCSHACFLDITHMLWQRILEGNGEDITDTGLLVLQLLTGSEALIFVLPWLSGLVHSQVRSSSTVRSPVAEPPALL